jgi:hypothetical protein
MRTTEEVKIFGVQVHYILRAFVLIDPCLPLPHCRKQEENGSMGQVTPPYPSMKMTANQGKPADGGANNPSKENAHSPKKLNDPGQRCRPEMPMSPQPSDRVPLARCNDLQSSIIELYYCKSNANFARNSAINSSRSAGTLLSFFGWTFGDC